MFYEYKDSYSIFRKLYPQITREQMYSIARKACDDSDATLSSAHLGWEIGWRKEGQPFYRVWPSVLSMLTRLDISKVSGGIMRMPEGLQNLLIQLPKGNKLNENGSEAEVVLVSGIETPQGNGLLIAVHKGEEQGLMPVLDMWLFQSADRPLAEIIDELPEESECNAPQNLRDNVIALVATLCLIGSNPELLEPILLTKDDAHRSKLGAEDLLRLRNKAIRRGRFGWDVGKSLDRIPHVRRPHPALVWTGEGRKTPRIVMRKGAIVHRQKIASVPQGYQDDETTN